MSPSNQVRIIAGKWRGRKLSFPTITGLRPTTDRIRETVFNWLQTKIVGARCLDLFAGSGALGFEALSRGAASVVFIDSDKKAIEVLEQNSVALAATAVEIKQTKAQAYCEQASFSQVDILFLDPPFAENMLTDLCHFLASSVLLQPNTMIYIEHNNQQSFIAPAGWRCLKEKKAGAVCFALWLSGD